MADPTPDPTPDPTDAPNKTEQAAPIEQPPDKPKTAAEIEAEVVERMRVEYEAKLAQAAEAARAEERQRIEAEQAAAHEQAEKDRRESEMSELERAEAQRVEAQRLADEATARAESEAAARAQDKAAAEERERIAAAEREKLNRQLEFQRTMSSSGLGLARDQAGSVDPALEELAFAEAERLRGSTGDMATALRDLAATKPWMFHRGEAPTSSNGGFQPPPARRIDPGTPPDTKPVFEQTPEEFAATRRKLGIVPR